MIRSVVGQHFRRDDPPMIVAQDVIDAESNEAGVLGVAEAEARSRERLGEATPALGEDVTLTRHVEIAGHDPRRRTRVHPVPSLPRFEPAEKDLSADVPRGAAAVAKESLQALARGLQMDDGEAEIAT